MSVCSQCGKGSLPSLGLICEHCWAKNEAYQRGRADMKKEILGGQPDGWCGWHPTEGWSCMIEPVLPSTITDGWEYRPVKIVAMGEEK